MIMKKNVKNKVVGIFFFAMMAHSAHSQTGYTTHKIQQGETLSGLAKQYGTTVGDIMRLNGMNSKSILRINEEVKIPSKKGVATATTTAKAVPPKKEPTAIPQTQAAVTTISGTPVTHTVVKGESLYRISKDNKVSIDQIKKWNNLPNENIKIGQSLIVGQSSQSTQASTAKSTGAPVIYSAGETTPAKPIPDYQIAKQASAPAAHPTDAEQTSKPDAANTGSPEGYFSSYFKSKSNDVTLTGNAGAFKTTSGWNDKKYYVLMNNVDAGTIVRLSSNNKSVCAKVLGPLPDIKEDTGLLLRVSNAAAAALGVDENKFSIAVVY